MRNKFGKIIFVSLLISTYSLSSFAKKLDCEHKFTDEIWGDKVEVCFAKNYTDYSPLEAANQFLGQQVLIKSGEFILKYKPNIKVNMPSFYFGKYLISYSMFNTYLKATRQWNDGKVGSLGSVRKRDEKYNGLYPAQANYDQAQGFCQWMGKITGLPIELPAYGQWLYAATSEGKNWEYPTNNGKLEIGTNYPDYESTDKKAITQAVTGLPINSLGIHQFFGNGWQWSSTVYDKDTAKYFSANGSFGEMLAGGTPYTYEVKYIKQKTLDSVFARTGKSTGNAEALFRCVINTDKPIPKHLDKLKD